MAWYSVKEAAERLGVSPRTIQKRIKRGKYEHRDVPNPGGGRPAQEIWIDETNQPGFQIEANTGNEANRSERRNEPKRTLSEKARPVGKERNEPRATKRTQTKRTGDRRSERNRTEPDDWKVGLTEKQIEVALFRHQIVSAVLAEPFRERGAKKTELVAREWDVPCSKKRRLTESTINRWITLWNRGGFLQVRGCRSCYRALRNAVRNHSCWWI